MLQRHRNRGPLLPSLSTYHLRATEQVSSDFCGPVPSNCWQVLGGLTVTYKALSTVSRTESELNTCRWLKWVNLSEDHSNPCPATDRMQLMRETQDRELKMVHSWAGWTSCLRHIHRSSAQFGPSEQAYVCVGWVQISLPYEGKRKVTQRIE